LPGSSFFVPLREARSEFREKASRFISCLYPAASVEEAEQKLAALKKEYFDASHICFAWIIGAGKDRKSRSSDAGEPKGTAGKPILEAIRSTGLTNILVAVVRYFGGTKLGTGGLSRAYRQAAVDVLQKCGKKKVVITEEVVLSVPLPLADRILRLAQRFKASVKSKEFGSDLKLTLAIPAEVKAKFMKEAEGLLRLVAG
jgi:uncharacterized YigZ family protein